MSRLGNAIAIIGAGMGGYMQGQRMREQQEAAREDREYQRRQRMRMDETYAREDQLRNDVMAAQQMQGHESAKFEAIANAHERALKPEAVAQYRALAQRAREEGTEQLIQAIQAQAPDIEALRNTRGGFVSYDLPADAVQNFDGVGKWKVPQGTVAQAFLGKDRYGKEVIDQRLVTPDGRVLLPSLTAASRALGMTPAQRQEMADRDAAADYTVRTKEREYTDGRADKRADLGIKERQVAIQEREAVGNDMLRRAQAGYYSQRGAAAGAAAGAPPQAAPVWDDKADTFLRTRYTVTDPTTGETMVDGQGLQFAKAIALAQAKRNGGDTTSALGYAFEVDARIKRQTGGDPNKIAAARSQLLQSATAPKEPAPPAPPAAATGARPQSPPDEATPTAPAAPKSARMVDDPKPPASYGDTPKSREPAPAVGALRQDFGSAALNELVKSKAGRIQAARAELDQAQQQLAAAGKSGDQRAIQYYVALVQRASKALDDASR